MFKWIKETLKDLGVAATLVGLCIAIPFLLWLILHIYNPHPKKDSLLDKKEQKSEKVIGVTKKSTVDATRYHYIQKQLTFNESSKR